MKVLLCVILALLQTSLLIGQDQKTKKRKSNESEGTATFYVLASNDTVRHGDYQVKAYSGNRILAKGAYSNNKREGLWEEQYYGKEYKGPKAKGRYDNGSQTGEWTYFAFSGDTAVIYNWTENKLVLSKACGTDKKEYRILQGGKEMKAILDCPPTCVVGNDYFRYELLKEMSNHSEHLNEVGKGLYQLKTKISLTIAEDGSVGEVSFSTDEKKELKEIINSYIRSFKWLPGTKDGKPVISILEFSVAVAHQF